DEDVTTIKAFMAITKDELTVGKTDIRSDECVEITMKRNGLLARSPRPTTY
nr:hypothetical protein [Tanacetum cinerariifolium]